jgi:hypothetical protein
MANRSGHRIAKLHDRLARGESAVMDGGMGTGLQAMGVPMDGEAWSGVANLTHANAVRELHAAYLAAGAEILIANTFATGPGPLSAAGYGSRFEEANRNAVAAAVHADGAVALDEVVVAGSMSRDVASGLADTGFHAPSRLTAGRCACLSPSSRGHRRCWGGRDRPRDDGRAEPPAGDAAAAELDIPVWLGIVAAAGRDRRNDRRRGRFPTHVRALHRLIDAVFVMHSDIGLVTDSLHVLRATWDGTVGAYPTSATGPRQWVFEEIAPARFADHAGEWVSNSATIVGRCCGGIGQAHPRAHEGRERRLGRGRRVTAPDSAEAESAPVVTVSERTDRIGHLCLRGPLSRQILQPLTASDLANGAFRLHLPHGCPDRRDPGVHDPTRLHRRTGIRTLG